MLLHGYAMRHRVVTWTLTLAALTACKTQFQGDDSGTTTNTGAESSSSGDPTTTLTTGPSETGNEETTTDESGSESGPSETGFDNQPPVIVDLNTTVTELTDGETVTFGAIVTDPDGVEDILGGQLTDPDENVVYGNFASGGGGSYSLELSWSELHDTLAIDTEGRTRAFKARFVDSVDQTDDELVDLTLSCDDLTLCDGICTDLESDNQNCGSCGKLCPDAGLCTAIGCPPILSECFYVPGSFETCDEACADIGETCVDNGCDGFSVFSGASGPICEDFPSGSNGTACADDLFDVNPGLSYRCCCGDT